MQKDIEAELQRLYGIINRMDRMGRYTAEDVAEEFAGSIERFRLSVFMQRRIEQIEAEERQRTAQTYRSTLRMFMEFHKNEDVDCEHIDCELMRSFEKHLQRRNLTRNTTSFYMRILRSVYNAMVAKNFAPSRNPFRDVYTGIDQTVKRAVDEQVIVRLKNYTSQNSGLIWIDLCARHVFL